MKMLPIFIAVLALTACSGDANVRPDFDLASAGADGEGMVIASFTTDSPYPDFHMWTRMRFDHPFDHSMQGIAEVEAESGCDLTKPGESPFKDNCGRLVALTLKAGQYDIYWFHTETGNIILAPREPVLSSFTVKAGRATYIGNIHMAFDKSDETFLGKPVMPTGWPAINDERERDIPLLEQLVPGLKPDLIDYEILILPPRGDFR